MGKINETAINETAINELQRNLFMVRSF